MSTPFMTNEEIVKKLTYLEELLNEVKAGKLIEDMEEVSLIKACRILKRGDRAVIKLIKDGKLFARSEKVKTRKGIITRYRILLKDIRAYQNGEVTVRIKEKKHRSPFEEVARKIVAEFQAPKIHQLNQRG